MQIRHHGGMTSIGRCRGEGQLELFLWLFRCGRVFMDKDYIDPGDIAQTLGKTTTKMALFSLKARVQDCCLTEKSKS